MPKIVDIIIPTYDRVFPLKCMLASLCAQTNPHWRVNVVIDNHIEMPAEEIVKSFDDDRITFSYLKKRYNDWGHTPREAGKQMSECDYIILTGDDCYYVPTFVEELSKKMEEGADFIYWDMVHNHYDYSYFKCEPWMNQIDMGAFATRRELAQQIKLDTAYAADGIFVQDFKALFPDAKMEKINKVLFVHN
jgi:GT2 family glycosyltransferase